MEANENAGKSIRSVDRSVVSSPSDEMKSSNKPQQHIQEGYHSVPESGDAVNVGLANSANDSKNSGPNFMAALETDLPGHPSMEQEQHRKNDFFEDELIRQTASELSSKIKRVASNASMFLISGDDPLSRRKTFVQTCYLGIAAIFGTLLRLILAQLFGQACSDPERIGWIADESVLCVTRDGTTTQNEGIIFADLPANLLASFIMGLLQDGAALGLALNLPIALQTPLQERVFEGLCFSL